MKEQFTLVAIPMDWYNPREATIVGIGIPSKISEKLGLALPGNKLAELIRDQFQKATGSEHDTTVLNSEALLVLQMGDVHIVAGAVFNLRNQESRSPTTDTVRLINTLNALNFGHIQK